VNRAAQKAGDVAVRAITRNPQANAQGVLREAGQMSPLASIVKPEGNINLRPILRAETLRGPDVQPLEAFLAQAKGTPGVTQDAFKDIATRYQDLAPGSKISKADFEARIPPSEYNKVDLYGSKNSMTDDDLIEQAYDMVNQDAFPVFELVMDRLNVRNIPDNEYIKYINALQDYHNGNIREVDLPEPILSALKRDGMLENPRLFENLVQDELNQAVQTTAEQIGHYGDYIADGYQYKNIQRLLPQKVSDALEDKYFEIGVSHPGRAWQSYRHYPGYDNSNEGLIGHVRGTFIPADKTDAIAIVPGGMGKERAVIPLKPKSMIIEEIQSDAQKGAYEAEQTGALRQAHGTLFKSAIDHALMNGATTVYYPTARTIAQVRSGDPKPYAAIYDQQIVREGLKPLGKIPGVTIKPIESMVAPAGQTPKPVVSYYEINFTPEAKEYILNGPGQLVPGYAGGGLFTKVAEGIGELAARYGTKAAPKEHKMLQGVYRGYAGEDPGETVFHAGAEFQRPNPGLFTNPERAAVEQFQQAMGSPKLHTFEAKPRRTGTDEDVYAMARRLGIYNPGIPASQYLEQGENAIFPEAARMVEELRGMGLDSLRLKDGMGKQPSLVALDPGVVRPAESVFASPQRRVAEYYAQKRAAQTGERPHVEMLLVDPFAGKKYGHSIPMDKFNREPVTTRARKLQPEQVKDRTKLYAAGGAVQFDPDEIAHLAAQAMHGYAEGGAVKYDPSEIEQLVAQMREEFHA
jgi:hypothetical protein